MLILFAALVVLPASSLGQGVNIFALTHEAFSFFNDMDENNDTMLTVSEIDDFFWTLDTNHTGNATHDDFYKYVDEHYPEFIHHEQLIYEEIDSDDDGYLTRTDFEIFVEKSDANNDMKITQAEFINYASKIFLSLEIVVEIEDYLTTPST